MSPFLQVLLSLFGAALLGNIIGWFARRIVAVRDERAMIEQHRHQMSQVQKELVHEREDNKSLNDRVASLEAQVADTDRLNQTIEASDKELRELRVESETLRAESQTLKAESQTLRAESQILKDESQTLKAESQTFKDESRTLQQELLDKNERLNNLDMEASRADEAGRPAEQARVPQLRQSPIANSTVSNHNTMVEGAAEPLHNAVAPGTAAHTHAANAADNGSIDLHRYALGSVASGTTEFEVDDDIADLTSDLSSVLTPEMQRELASPDASNLSAGAAGHSPTVANTRAANPDPLAGSQKQQPVAGVAAAEGLFSRFNRKKKS